MTDKEILAIMYNFYNKHILRGQNDDIPYYIEQIKNYSSKEVLIVGAGTGRVANPLSKYTNVTALDFDLERLKLLKKVNPKIKTIGNDFIDAEFNNIYDLIIIPYSTLQFDGSLGKLNSMLNKIYKISDMPTITIFDVSESFNTKEERDNQFLFRDYCKEVNDFVEVYYSSRRYEKYIEFIIEYKLINNKRSVIEKERYYFYNEDLLTGLINKNNLTIIKKDNGYGQEGFKHKHLYHCRRKK